MPHDLSFADAARPIPVVILKLPLRSYSLGHQLLLLQRRNALLLCSQAEFNTFTVEDQIYAVREGVWTCCNTWSENEGQKLSRLKLKIWDWRIRKTSPEGYSLAIAEFRNYLVTGQSMPPVADSLTSAIAAGEAGLETCGRSLGSPLLANLINFVSSRPKLFDGCALMDVPYGYAAWLYLSEMEAEGRIKIENQKEYEVRVEMDEAKSAALAEEQAMKSTGMATAPPDFGKDDDA